MKQIRITALLTCILLIASMIGCSEEETNCYEFHKQSAFRELNLHWTHTYDTICGLTELEAEALRVEYATNDSKILRNCQKKIIKTEHKHKYKNKK